MRAHFLIGSIALVGLAIALGERNSSEGSAALSDSGSEPAELRRASPNRQPASVARVSTTAAKSQGSEAPASAPRAEKEPLRASPDASSDLQRLYDDVTRLEACYTSDCGYDRSTSRSDYFDIGQNLKSVLFSAADRAQTGELRESTDLSRLARHELVNPDGHVQEAALALMETQSPSPENRDAILANVIAGNDGQLIERAMAELGRYTDEDSRATIQTALAEALTTGSPFVATAVSVHLSPFISNESYGFYSSVLSQISPSSRVALNVRAQLLDWTRRQTGA